MTGHSTHRIGLQGLSVGDENYHAALQRSVHSVMDPDGARDEPIRRVLLDWGNCSGVSAEGIAFFPVLVRTFREKGIEVRVGCPRDAECSYVLAATGFRDLPEVAEWIEAPIDGRVSSEIPCKGEICDLSDRSQRFSRFLGSLGAAVDSYGDNAELMLQAAVEVIQNSLAHASAESVAVVALVRKRTRPKRIEFGIADSGQGAANHALRNSRFAELAPFSDAMITEVLIRGSESGRTDGGGGFGQLMGVLSDAGGDVLIRTGTALLTLRDGGWKRSRLSCGLGTQIRLSLPLP